MKKKAIVVAALALILSGCGLDGRVVQTRWYPVEGTNQEVLCAGASDGGIDCDWASKRTTKG